MTLLLIISGLMIAFILLLRYDIHKHKYADPKKLEHNASRQADTEENRPSAHRPGNDNNSTT